MTISVNRQQAYLDLLAEGGNTGLWSYGAAEPRLWADANARKLLRSESATTLDELLASVDATERQELQAEITQACAAQSGFARTVRLFTGEGQVFPITLRGRWSQVDASGQGELLCVVEKASNPDSVADQQHLESDSKRLERIQVALSASPVSLFEQDCDLRYRWMFAPRLGEKAQTFIGQRASNSMSTESALELDRAKRAVIQSGEPARARFDLLYVDGAQFSVDAYMAPTRGPDGAVNGVVSVSIDLAESAKRERKLLAAIEQAPIGIFLSRLSDGTLVNVNAHFEHLFGYTKKEAIGSSPLQLQLWCPPSSGNQFLESLIAEGHVRNRITDFRHKDGHMGRALVSAERVEDHGESLLLGMVNDISALEDTRHKLAFSEARYQLLAESSIEGVALLREGIVVEVNAQMAKILAVPREALIGQQFDRCMQASSSGEPDISGLLGPVTKIYSYVRPDGVTISAEVSLRKLAQGGDAMHIATLRDITEKVASERSLRSLQVSIDHLMSSNVVGMMVVETSGAIVEANDYVLNMLQRSRAELGAGQLNWMEMTPPEFMYSEVRLQMHEQVLSTGYCPAFERPMLRLDGTVVHMLMAVALQPDCVNRALIIALDITEQKSVQAKLMELNAQLEKRTAQAERAEAVKALFLSSISHELRTPLHTILGYVRLLRKKSEGEDEHQLGIVERHSTHLLRLIDDLLEFNHTSVAPESLRVDFVDMDGFVSSLVSMFANMAEQTGNQFHLKLAAVLPVGIVMDEGRLVQILRILVDNACKYTTEGHITLTLDSQSAVDANGRCRLYFAVEDTGRGIDQTDQDHIFEPLRRGRNAEDRPGLGLGLAIAEQWIQRMGSRIEVQSQLGVGSCFSFELCLEACFEVLPKWRPPRALQLLPRQAATPTDEPPLPPAELEMLGQLISMGRMGRLSAWARELAANHPELQCVSERLANMAINAEVDALERLYQRWVAQAASMPS